MCNFVVFSFVLCFLAMYSEASVLTSGEYEDLKGEDFCTPTNSERLKMMCVKLATKEPITDYDSDVFNDIECADKVITLVERDDAKTESTKVEKLLDCEYKYKSGKLIKHILLGRGSGKLDAFKYSYLNGKLMAESNLSKFLEAIPLPPRN